MHKKHFETLDGFTTPASLLKNYRTNQFNKWNAIGLGASRAASNRFNDDFFYCASPPKPSSAFKKSDRVFTMGSCFARSIEDELENVGIGVLTNALNIPLDYYQASVRRPSAALNKFNIPSMLTALQSALGKLPVCDDWFVDVGGGLYFDTSTSGLRDLSLEELRQVQVEVNATNALIKEADIFIITLGLVEMFVDLETGSILNTSPKPILNKRYPGRFAHYFPSYAVLRPIFEEMLRLVFEVNSAVNVVVTVSPVPLQATMTDMDVVVANTSAKSLLRLLAGDICRELDNCHYFPSYEMIMNSKRDSTWHEDNIHVQAEQVANVTKAFLDDWFE